MTLNRVARASFRRDFQLEAELEGKREVDSRTLGVTRPALRAGGDAVLPGGDGAACAGRLLSTTRFFQVFLRSRPQRYAYKYSLRQCGQMNEPTQVPDRRFCSTHSNAYKQCEQVNARPCSASACESVPERMAPEPEKLWTLDIGASTLADSRATPMPTGHVRIQAEICEFRP